MSRSSKLINVTATIVCPGDMSVGIPDGYIKVDFGNWTSYDAFFKQYEDGREEHRGGIEDWVDKFHENCGACYVIYGDECFDCGNIGCKGECCNFPEKDEFIKEYNEQEPVIIPLPKKTNKKK